MKIRQAFKFKLAPNGAQVNQLLRYAGACRYVYNKALALQKANFSEGNKYIHYTEMASCLVAWKKETDLAWLKDMPSQSLQHALKDLDKAYDNFFKKRAGFPTFRKRNHHSSFRVPQGFEVDQNNHRIRLPKLGWISYRKSRLIEGDAKNITLSLKAGKWYASIQTERVIEPPISKATTAIGIDVGITHFATLDTGVHIAAPNYFKTKQLKLARYQRRMSRKKKYSKNWIKAKQKVQQIHHDIANARSDFLHKTTTTLSKNHALVCIEDLQIVNMTKSAKGNCDKQGKNVRQKSGLNRAILDQGWGEFRRQLDYKQAWRGGILLAVPPKHTSRTCPCCQHISKDNRKTQATFVCVACGYHNNADVVGAINILERGHRLLAFGEKMLLGLSMNQEPAEVSQVLVA
jgi:putative transposase